MAAKKPTKKQKKAAKQWLIALILGALVMTIPALFLKSEPEPMESQFGIDVSSHQGVIDWEAVANTEVEFIMVRLGYRSYRDGSLNVDTQALANLDGARAAGLRVGAYFFSQAINETEAREEAAFAIEILDGRELDLPLAYDWEPVAESTRTKNVDRDTLTACVRSFCDNLQGYAPAVYFNLEISKTLLDTKALPEYDFWFAQYADTPELGLPIRFWQYSDQGQIDGIEEKVDLNRYYPG